VAAPDLKTFKLVEDPASTGSWPPYKGTGGDMPNPTSSSVLTHSIPSLLSAVPVLKYLLIGDFALQLDVV